jgi:hypothetical protein
LIFDLGVPRGAQPNNGDRCIILVDETGWLFNAPTGTSWARTGKTPILRRISKRLELSTVIGLTINGRIYKRHSLKSVGGAEVIKALKHFARHIPGLLSQDTQFRQVSDGG